MKRILTKAGLAAALGGIGAYPAYAADSPAENSGELVPIANERVFSAFVAIGAGVAPEFDGSDKYEAIPFAIANVKWHGVELQLRGLQARLDLLGDSPWDVGPIVNLRGKRDDDVKGPVRRLAEIDTAVEGGGFVGYRFGGGPDGQGEIGIEASFLHDVSGEHEGFTATVAVSYAAIRWGQIFANVDADATYGDKSYNRTYFGVTRAGSAASGLRAYRPDAGFKDVGAGLTVGYQINERWGVLGRASVTRYVGEAADSPIVKDGSKTAGLFGLAVSYRY